MNRLVLFFSVLTATLASAFPAETVIDFEQAEVGKPVTNWVEKGVVFTLAHEPKQTRARGRVMLFPHLCTNHKGILCAMATEQIPVQATLPTPVTSVTSVLWRAPRCSGGSPCVSENSKVLDQASVPSVPGRRRPEDRLTTFERTVKAWKSAYIRFS